MWYNVKAIYNSKPKGTFIMKKNCFKTTLAGIMVAAMCINLTACGINEKVDDKKEISDSTNVTDEKSETANEIETASESVDFQTELTNNSLFDYEVRLNGEVIALPVEMNDILSRGWTITEESELRTDLIKNDSAIRLFDIKEENGEKVAHSATFTGSYYESDKVYVCELPKGIALGDSNADDIIATYGEPDEKMSLSNSKVLAYYDPSESSTANRHKESSVVAFEVNKDGRLFDVTLKNFK